MKLPLVVFSLLLVLVTIVINLRPGGERLKALLRDMLPLYTLLGMFALLSITFGKPGQYPQYLAWGVVALAVAQFAAHIIGKYRTIRLAGILAALLLGVLFFLELPFFSQLPP